MIAMLKSKGLWVTVAVTIAVLVVVNRVPFVNRLVYGAPASK